MMPGCYKTWNILFWIFHCPNTADHIEVVDGNQIAACNDHHKWFLQQIAKMNWEAYHNGRSSS